MSLIDKIKAMFSGGSDSHDHDSHAGHDHAHSQAGAAVDDAPPAPVDPMGAPMPPADADERP